MDFPAELAVRNFLSAMYPSEKAAMWIFAIMGIFFFVAGAWLWHSQLEWDARVRDWERVDGVITRNELVRSGRRDSSRRTELRYRYFCRGREYEGRRIVYDLDRYPRVKVGSVCRIIVDPAAPERSAALVTFTKYGRWIRYKGALLAGAAAAILFLLLIHLRFRRPPELPEKLVRYLMTVPVDERSLTEAPPRLRDFGGRISHPPRLGSGPGVCMLGDGAWGTLIFTALLAAAACVLLWHDKLAPGLAAGILALLIGLGAFPPRLKLDFITRTIRRSRLPWHDSADPEEMLSFSAIRRLEVFPARIGRGICAILVAVSDANEAWVLGRIAQRRVAMLLAFLPDLATELGHLPVAFRAKVLDDPLSPRRKSRSRLGA